MAGALGFGASLRVAGRLIRSATGDAAVGLIGKAGAGSVVGSGVPDAACWGTGGAGRGIVDSVGRAAGGSPGRAANGWLGWDAAGSGDWGVADTELWDAVRWMECTGWGVDDSTGRPAATVVRDAVVSMADCPSRVVWGTDRSATR